MTIHETERHQGGLLPIPRTIGTIALGSMLWDRGVPVDCWGQGYTKTLGDLKQEIEHGEAELFLTPEGKIQRRVNLVWLDVLYLPSGDRFVLTEERQEFANGGARKRDLPASLGEKMLTHETTGDAVYRALQEELGVDRVTHHYQTGAGQEVTFRNKYYPGLDNVHISSSHVVVIPDDQFKPGGYIEYQQDKTNFYVWDKM